MQILYSLLICISLTGLVNAIQGGEFHGALSFPYQVQIYNPLGFFRVVSCGAAIISERWLISAAHCVGMQNERNVQIRLGSSSTLSKGKMVRVEKIVVHGDSDNLRGWESDISLLKTATPIEFNEFQQPIVIARDPPKVGDVITISGFGNAHYRITVQALKIARMPVIEQSRCAEQVDYLSERMFCTRAGDVDLCHGDSGSPAVLNGKLVGVVSRGCEYDAPSVFTKVPEFYDWIMKVTGIKYED